ncbi:MAG: SDR family oxidoreductase [Sediminibacterium sp.]
MEKKKRVLFTGGSGLLALNWAMHIKDHFEVVLGIHKKVIAITGIQSVHINMETTDSFFADLEKIQPDIVIHCAGLANVEACEADPEAAHHINVVLSVNVAKACKEQGVRFVYISTDHLFSGKDPLVSEEERPSPLNEYGRTKLEAENRIFDISDKNISIRTNFYGWGPSYRSSFSDMIIYNMRNNQTVSLFTDFFYTPIVIEELALTTMLLIDKNANGIFNVVGNQRISKYEFGILIADYFQLDPTLIKATLFSERKDLVKRPGDLSLSVKKTMSFLGNEIGSIQQNIKQLKRQEQTGLSSIIHSL